MKQKTLFLILAFLPFLFNACNDDEIPGPPGPAGLDAEVYFSEWFSPTDWSGEPGDWYFEASAPDLTADIVDGGVILAYAWLADDIYPMGVRQLPAYAVGANWDYIIPEFGSIEFICDMNDRPLSSGNKFRFIAIPGNIPALKSASLKSAQDLRNMPYQEVCKLLNIPE